MSKPGRIPETAAGLVGDAMKGIVGEAAHEAAARDRDAERVEARERRSRLAAGVLVPLCVVLTALNLSGFQWFTDDGAPHLPPAEARTAALLLLSDAADELEFSRRQNGHYPEIPGFVGPDGPAGEDEPFSYRLLGGGRYVISVTVADEVFLYDSREDPDTAFAEVRDVR